jgi:tetraacyldisaccharide 4'-kinase
MVLVAHAPGIPVLVGRDRGIVGLRAVSAFGADVLVLDDGFQHHRLMRDVDVVTLDANFGLGNGYVLPRGPLREHPSALSRADAICVIDGSLRPADEWRVKRWAPGAPRFHLRRRPAFLRSLSGDSDMSVEELAGMKVGLFAGIADPKGFRLTLEGLGAEVIALRTFRDHHRYRAHDLRHLAERAPVWVTTEKDAVKLLPSWAPDLDLRVLGIELEIDAGEQLSTWLEARVLESLQARRSTGQGPGAGGFAGAGRPLRC